MSRDAKVSRRTHMVLKEELIDEAREVGIIEEGLPCKWTMARVP